MLRSTDNSRGGVLPMKVDTISASPCVRIYSAISSASFPVSSMLEPSGSHTSTVKYCLSSAGTNTLGMNLKLHAESTSSKTMQAIVA